MTFDLLVTNATLPDGRPGHDIAVTRNRIVSVEPNVAAEAGTVLDAAGQLVSPRFVDPHVHMDSTLSLGPPRLNQSARCWGGP